MAPKTKDENTAMAVEAELLRLGEKSRLIGAPELHLHEIGELARQQHIKTMGACTAIEELANLFPKGSREALLLHRMASDLAGNIDINPYTHAMYVADEQVRRHTVRNNLTYSYNPVGLVFEDKTAWEKMLRTHFLPFHWPELESASDFMLWRDVIPAITVASPKPEIYEQGRWLFDEEAQRSAETLRFRLEQRGGLPDVIPTRETAQATQDYIATVISKLRQGMDVRRWLRGIKG